MLRRPNKGQRAHIWSLAAVAFARGLGGDLELNPNKKNGPGVTPGRYGSLPHYAASG